MTLIAADGLHHVIHRFLGDYVAVNLTAASSHGARKPLLKRKCEHFIERDPTFHDLARPVIEVGLSPPCVVGLCRWKPCLGLTLRVKGGLLFRR